jgi:hypothetical protein
MKTHALLSPSGASRWLACTPSARLEEQFPDRAGEAAREGTLAHTLSEVILGYKLGLINEPLFEQGLAEIQNDDLYTSAMYDHAENYSVFVLERLSDAKAHTKDALIFLEQKLNLTDYIPEGFGTGDAVIIADGILDTIDLKYGKGVSVSAENNKQMMLYALGALREFDYMYDITTVRMTIHQPRIDNYSSWEIPVSELRKWAEEELKPKAQAAFEGKGEYMPGEHCRFCKAKAVCKANADYNLELAQYEFKAPALLTDEEVVDILNRMDAFTTWLKAVDEHTLYEAVNNGKKWPGYKLVEGRSNRKYSDETVVASKLLTAGFAEDLIYKKELLGITAMEKAVGKKQFTAIVSDLLVKPDGKPTLVPASDKRPEYHSSEAAIKDFSNN